jgi:hypothetical protein
VPLPAQITIRVLPRIDLEPAQEPDAVYEKVTARMQEALDELAAERDLPLVGSVTPRSG